MATYGQRKPQGRGAERGKRSRKKRKSKIHREGNVIAKQPWAAAMGTAQSPHSPSRAYYGRDKAKGDARDPWHCQRWDRPRWAEPKSGVRHETFSTAQ